MRSLEVAGVKDVVGHPVIFADMRYDSVADGKPRELKVMFHDDSITRVLCTHDAIGYRATFERITKGFAASLKVRAEESTARRTLAKARTLDQSDGRDPFSRTFEDK